MTNKNKYLTIIFSLLVFSVMALSIYKILKKPINPEFDFEKDIQSKDIHLISYGFQFTMPEDFNAKKKVDSVEKELGFYWENYGCMVDSESNVLANDYNENVIKYLGKRNGVDWFKKYINKVDSIYKNVK